MSVSSRSSVLCRAMRLSPVAVLLLVVLPLEAHAEQEWLSMGSKAIAPTIFSKTGTGSAQSVAEARFTRKAIEEWCENWSAPGDKECVGEQLGQYDLKKVYRASADCKAGRIVTVDGDKFTLAGVWGRDGGFGEGRTKWRDAAGAVVGTDNASNGLAISQQWEVLCPGPPPKPVASGATGPGTATPGTAAPGTAAAGKVPAADPAKGLSFGITLTNPFRK